MAQETSNDVEAEPRFYDQALPAEAYYSDSLPALYGEGRTIGVTLPSDIAITPQQAREFGSTLIKLADYAERLRSKAG